MSFIFANFIKTTLSSALTTGGTSISIANAAGIPAPSAGQQIALVLNDAATQTIFEVVYCTAISGTTLTVTRAQEGTSALAWNVGDYIFAPSTAGQSQAVPQILGDLGGTYLAPEVVNTHLSSALPVAQGGTGNTTGQPSGTASGDLSGSYPSPTVVATHLSSALPVAQGGTGSTTVAGAQTTLGVVVGPATSTANDIPKFANTSGNLLADGYTVGTAANNILQLNASAQLPAVSGALLTNIATSVFGRTGAVAATTGDYSIGQISATGSSTGGHTLLTNNILIQWGAGNFSGSGTGAITFPTAFPTSCLGVIGIMIANTSTNSGVTVNGISTTGATLYACNGSSASGAGYYFFAWGY